jgi:hypothetical protein
MEKISVKWNASPATVRRITNSYIKQNMNNIRDNITFFSEVAAEYIEKEAILRGSPTGTMWHRMVNKERGNEYGARYETGQMAKNVGFLPADEMQDGYSESEFGLFTGGDEYFMRQEYGFELQVKNGVRKVPGMYSASRAIKFTRPVFRKKMLASGFLRGKKDSRGERVLSLMGGTNRFGENVGATEFGTAWRATAPVKSEAAKQAYLNMLQRSKDLQSLRAMNDAKWAANRRVIDALEFGRKYAQETYKANSRKRRGE